MSERELLVVDTTGRSDYPPEALAHLSDLAITIEPRRATSEEEIIEACADADAILVTAGYVTRRVMETLAPKLRVVVRYGVGLDRIDLDAARRFGIEVRNVRDFCTTEVADHAVALMLAVARDIVPAALNAKQGRWRRSERTLQRIDGGIAGIVGLGDIGQAVAKRLAGFGLALMAHDPYADPRRAETLGARLVGIDQLVAEADLIMLTCPLTEETRGIISRERLSMMKPEAIVVNTSRGGLIDEEALAEALSDGHIAGAGLDVLEQEPAPDDHPLLALDNAVITPHIAYASEQASYDLVIGAMRELADALRGI